MAFSDAVEVRVSATGHLGHLYVYRGTKLVPMYNPPELNGEDVVYLFDTPESGILI